MLFFISRVGGHEVAFSMKPWGGGGGEGGDYEKRVKYIYNKYAARGEKKKKKLCSVTSGGNKNDR